VLWVQQPFSERVGRLKTLIFSYEAIYSGFTHSIEDKCRQNSVSQQADGNRVTEITKENQEAVHMEVV
jgi:hypothetical protein